MRCNRPPDRTCEAANLSARNALSEPSIATRMLLALAMGTPVVCKRRRLSQSARSSFRPVLHGLQVIDELVDHRIDFRALGLGLRARQIVEADAPHRHFARTVCAILQTSVDRTTHVFARELAAEIGRAHV